MANPSSGKTSIIGAGSGYKSEAAFAFRSKPVKLSDKMANNKAVLKNVKTFLNVFSPFFFRGLKDNTKKPRKNIYTIYEHFLYENLQMLYIFQSIYGT
ncbi:TPA: hypothetical protein ACGYJJ_001084, partial [Listeria monocytogenes]